MKLWLLSISPSAQIYPSAVCSPNPSGPLNIFLTSVWCCLSRGSTDMTWPKERVLFWSTTGSFTVWVADGRYWLPESPVSSSQECQQLPASSRLWIMNFRWDAFRCSTFLANLEGRFPGNSFQLGYSYFSVIPCLNWLPVSNQVWPSPQGKILFLGTV